MKLDNLPSDYKSILTSTLRFVVPVSEMKGDDAEDSELLEQMFVEARAYPVSFKWCGGTQKEYFGFGNDFLKEQ
jgi:hypothetical protein